MNSGVQQRVRRRRSKPAPFTIRRVRHPAKRSARKGWPPASGKKVMQFIQERRYVAVVADRKVILYGK
jgi:hypothetical protein